VDFFPIPSFTQKFDQEESTDGATVAIPIDFVTHLHATFSAGLAAEAGAEHCVDEPAVIAQNEQIIPEQVASQFLQPDDPSMWYGGMGRSNVGKLRKQQLCTTNKNIIISRIVSVSILR
jgi:hypothetical protein